MKVLIIDDEAGVRRTLSMILEDEGYQVISASDGREGIERALQDEPDLILCDIRMPRMDGLEFLEEYRKKNGQALVITITAYGSNELAVEAMISPRRSTSTPRVGSRGISRRRLVSARRAYSSPRATCRNQNARR